VKEFRSSVVSVFILTMIAGFAARLEAGTFTALVDKTVGSVDDQFEYTLSISGKADEPEIPKVPGLTINKVGTSQSYSMQGFGNMTRKVDYTYLVTAEKEGKYTIPSISLKVDGEMQKTAPIHITVSNTPTGSSGEEGGEAAPLFIKRTLKKKEVYVGEQILSKVEIFSRVRILEAGNISENSTDFRRYGSEHESRSQRMYQGAAYDVIEVSEAYVPLKEGSLTLPAFKLKTKIALPRQNGSRRSRDIFDDFFGGSMFGGGRAAIKVIRSPEDTILVKPLPTEGRPKDFSNLVGQFGIDADLSSNKLDAGDTVTLTITVQGKGVLSGMSDPELGLDPSIKVYPDKPSLSENFQESVGVVGTRVLKYALVPTRPGEYQIPDIVINVFDPDQGKYLALNKSLGKLIVGGTVEQSVISGGNPVFNQQKQVKVLNEDIISFHQGEKLSSNQALTRRDLIVVAAMSLLPVVIILCLALFTPFYRLYSGSDQHKYSKAWSRYQSEIKNLTNSQDDFLTQVKLFREYVGDRCGVNGGALTDEEICGYLTELGVSGELLNRLKDVLSSATKVEFAGIDLSGEQVQGSRDTLTQIAKEVRKV